MTPPWPAPGIDLIDLDAVQLQLDAASGHDV
jgi:hypothetical protein